jgi:hypothetical protein
MCDLMMVCLHDLSFVEAIEGSAPLVAWIIIVLHLYVDICARDASYK